MVSKRSIPLWLILSIFVPFAALIWFVLIAGDVKKLRGEDGPNGILHLLLGIITCGIFFWYCYYQYSKYIEDVQKAKGKPVSDISVIALIIGIFFGVVSMALIQNELNKFDESES